MPPYSSSSPSPSPPPPLHPHSFGARIIVFPIVALALAAAGAAVYFFATQPQPLSTKSAPKTIGIAYFRQGLSSIESLKRRLSEMGYTNLRYIAEEVHIGPSMAEDMRRMYAGMFDEGVDLIFADHEHMAKVALEMTKERGIDTPIVYIIRFHDPVEYGLADSFRSSGNNATGVAGNLSEVTKRTLQFIQEINPKAKKIGIFGAGFQVPDVAARYFSEFKGQVADFGMEIVEYSTQVPPPQAEAEFNRVASAIKKGDVDALVHIPGHFYDKQEEGEYELAKRLGVPMSAPYEDLQGGGQFSFSTNYSFAGEEAAVMVDKIFKGKRPSEIPVEYGARNDLTLNLTRARETGIKFTDSMLYIATDAYEEGAGGPDKPSH
jgi:putative tryptophan/tyrosine transport system substrate-binding protein